MGGTKQLIAAQEGVTLELESTLVGDKEQPTVSYFIPWQGTDGPDDLRWSLDGHFDNSLEIINRDVLIRSHEIYEQLGMERAE